MTVKELKNLLDKMPDDEPVVIADKWEMQVSDVYRRVEEGKGFVYVSSMKMRTLNK